MPPKYSRIKATHYERPVKPSLRQARPSHPSRIDWFRVFMLVCVVLSGFIVLAVVWGLYWLFMAVAS